MQTNAIVERTLTNLLAALGVSHTGIAQSEIAGQRIFSIGMEDGRGLIGPRGETLQALDFLVKKIVEKQVSPRTQEIEKEADDPPARSDELLFLIDVNEYRAKQIQDLQSKALMMAERAKSFQYDVELSPMSSYERLIVHTALADVPNVKTESQGEGRNRRVVIKYSS